MKNKRDLDRLLLKFKTNCKQSIIMRYVNDDIEEIEEVISELQEDGITIDDENLEVIKYIFDEYVSTLKDEELIDYVDANIDIVTKSLIKSLLAMLDEVIYHKNNEDDFETILMEEKKRLMQIKEKEYITEKEVFDIYNLKKDMLLTLRHRKELEVFQIDEQGKVLYSQNELKSFMKKYTR